jgi:hypothetical protein
MKNFFLSILFALSLTLIPGCADRNKTTTTGANVPTGSTVPPAALEQQKVVDTATHADDGSSLKTIAEIDQKIAANKSNIALLEKANVILAQMKIDVQVAIDQTWGYLLAGFFSLAAIAVGIYAVLWSIPGTKLLFTKIAIALGLFAVIILTLSIYLPAVFIIAKYVALAFVAGLIGVAIYFIHALVKEGAQGNLSEEMEKLPLVGHFFMEANKVAATVSTDIKSVNAKVEAAVPEVSKIEATVKTDVNVAVNDATAVVKTDAAKLEASVGPGVAKVEAAVKKEV